MAGKIERGKLMGNGYVRCGFGKLTRVVVVECAWHANALKSFMRRKN